MHPTTARSASSQTLSLRASRLAAGKPRSEAIASSVGADACATAPLAVPRPRLLDRLLDALRVHGCTLATEQAYVTWTERYLHYHRPRHHTELDEGDVARFLRHLERDLEMPPDRRNQAFAALVFFYREVVDRDLDWRRVISATRRRRVEPSSAPIVVGSAGTCQTTFASR
jgi:hypothetical protein